MKGIVLAGGMGTRLAPLTQNDNKHYLPVYDKRMVEYPIKTLVDSGIRDIIIVCGGKNPGQFIELLGSGKSRGIDNLYYTYQQGNGGIAEALYCAEKFADSLENCIVILGDNYFEEQPNLSRPYGSSGARVFLRKTNTPWHFGIAEVSEGKIISIEEKPSKPRSDLAILGLYQFDWTVFSRIKALKMSDRKEYEVTDLLKSYMDSGDLEYDIYDGYWSDMGTFETWTEVSQRIATRCIS